METDASSRPSAPGPPPTEWRALSRLRERVEEAVAEIERLRAQNAALARRVADLQEEMNEGGGLALPGGADAAELRTKIQGFIEAIDDVLAVGDPEPDPVAGGDGAADPSDTEAP